MKAASSIFTALSAAVFGFFIGISFPVEITPKLQYCAFLPCDGTNTNSSSSSDSNNNMLNFWAPSVRNSTSAPSNATISGNGTTTAAAAVAKKPQGAERLPPGIVVRDSDLHLHRLWGHPTSVHATAIYMHYVCLSSHRSLGAQAACIYTTLEGSSTLELVVTVNLPPPALSPTCGDSSCLVRETCMLTKFKRLLKETCLLSKQNNVNILW
jgi:hypothetical protein